MTDPFSILSLELRALIVIAAGPPEGITPATLYAEMQARGWLTLDTTEDEFVNGMLDGASRALGRSVAATEHVRVSEPIRSIIRAHMGAFEDARVVH